MCGVVHACHEVTDASLLTYCIIVTDCYHSLEDTTAVGDSIKSSNNSTTETGAVIEGLIALT